MPLHLETLDHFDQLRSYASVFIVWCPICPPVSLASDTNTPFMQFFRHGIKTPAFEEHIGAIRESLEKDGIRTGVFTSYLPCPATCLWTSGQRNRLLKQATEFDAVLVMGCESARHTVAKTLKGTDCEVILAMQLVGITNAHLKFEFPLTIRLDNLDRVSANEQAR